MTTECTADAKGPRRLRKLTERVAHINEQIAELLGKKFLIWWEILQIRAGELVAWVKRRICKPCLRETLRHLVDRPDLGELEKDRWV